MKYLPLETDLFKSNRKNFMAQMEPNSIGLFVTNGEMPRSADGFFPFRQNSDLFYLTGIDQEETALILIPNPIKEGFEEILFIRETNDHIRIWEGHKHTKEEARKISGIEKIYWKKDFWKIIASSVSHYDFIYLNNNEHNRFTSPIKTEQDFFIEEVLDRYPLHHVKRSSTILRHLRSIKSDREIKLIRKACEITRDAFIRVCKFVKPGVTEYEIEAEIMHEFLRKRATETAYSSIIASGENALCLHYTKNNSVCEDGEVILMDFGSEYANYASDLTRTIPVNGKYTERQKAVYNTVLHVFKEARNMLRPGTSINDYHTEVGKIMEDQLIGLGLLDKDEVAKQDPKSPLYKKYFMHGTSHHIGLDVHDFGPEYHEPIKSGMVFTCEPGIYIPDEKLGIRIENDIQVTDGEPIDLMHDIPLEIEEIEDLMNS